MCFCQIICFHEKFSAFRKQPVLWDKSDVFCTDNRTDFQRMVSAVDDMRIEDQQEMTKSLINNNSVDCLSLEIDSVSRLSIPEVYLRLVYWPIDQLTSSSTDRLDW